MKKFTIKNVLDGFRSSVAQPARPDQIEIQETLRPEHFQVKRTFRHGFPYQPTAMAYDPIQRLLAIGTKCGSLRILGRPGVDAHVRHDMDSTSAAVLHIQFLVNEGALVTATADDTLHLWNLRQKVPQVVQKLRFQRERITCMHLPMQSKWLYLGTDRGNIHIVHIESFVLSGYVINWNKAIEVSRKTHPGAVVHLSDNPLDASKLLIGYETGQMVLWDLRAKQAEFRCQTQEPLRSAAWHHEGKQFMCAHTDGSLTTWQLRQPQRPLNVSQPHARPDPGGGRPPDACKPIGKVEWKSSKSGEAYVIFSGGTAYDQAGRTPSITVIHAKTTTVLEMEHNVVDFITLCETPWLSEQQEPYAIVVLLQNDLVVMDLQTAGYPCLENPYPMDVHESPVTCCQYMADCPADLVPAFYSVGRTAKRTGFSDREWPISGGEWHAASCSYSEIIITGHADGSIKFWDGSAGTLQILYKLKTNKVFERPRQTTNSEEDEPFAIEIISMCPESRKLCIAGASGHVILFKFRKQESTSETAVLEIPIPYDNDDNFECSPIADCPRSGSAGRLDLGDDCKKDSQTTLRVRAGPVKKAPGFQAQLVCLTPWVNGEPPSHITSLAINSSYGLLAYGNECGIVIVDIVQKISLLNIGSPDLYGAQDPYSRAPRSPKRSDNASTEARSPSIDQLTICPSSPTNEPFEETTPTSQTAAPEYNSQERRRNSTWQKFNFKRQLSKVDNKIKTTFGDKRGSIFYAPDEEEGTVDVSPEDPPTEVGEECLEKELPKTQQRPDNLALEDNDLAPTRPPRGKRKPLIKLQVKPDVKDLREGNEDTEAIQQPPPTSFMRRFNKLDSSFSRSRSSSMSSLENITSEAITALSFADSYIRKNEPTILVPTLWVGTSLGSVVTIMIGLPDAETRSSQPVVVSLVGATIFRLKGAIMALSFLDCNGALIPYSFELWRDENKDKKERTPTKSQCRMSPTLSGENKPTESFGDRQFVVICSEKQARVVALPSQTCVYRQQITDSDFVVKAETVSIRDSVLLICYVSSGHLMAYSLPSLRPLVDIDFLPLSELSFQTHSKQGIVDPMLSIWGQQLIVNEDTDQIARTFCFSNRGHGLYLTSPSELQKFTICADFIGIMPLWSFGCVLMSRVIKSFGILSRHVYDTKKLTTLTEMMGELFLALDFPEPPKESFFKGLFGGGVRNLDREELFGEAASGKASKAVAKHIPGQAMQDRVNITTSEISRAHQLAMERGVKLNQLEEKTEKMMNEAENFSSSAHSLMLKYKDKKWYQL